MKNFNRRSSYGHHDSKLRELAQYIHTHRDCTHSHTHLHQHSYNHEVQSASSAITEFGIHFFILKVPEGGEANWGTGRKPPTVCPLIGITY